MNRAWKRDGRVAAQPGEIGDGEVRLGDVLALVEVVERWFDAFDGALGKARAIGGIDAGQPAVVVEHRHAHRPGLEAAAVVAQGWLAPDRTQIGEDAAEGGDGAARAVEARAGGVDDLVDAMDQSHGRRRRPAGWSPGARAQVHRRAFDLTQTATDNYRQPREQHPPARGLSDPGQAARRPATPPAISVSGTWPRPARTTPTASAPPGARAPSRRLRRLLALGRCPRVDQPRLRRLHVRRRRHAGGVRQPDLPRRLHDRPPARRPRSTGRGRPPVLHDGLLPRAPSAERHRQLRPAQAPARQVRRRRDPRPTSPRSRATTIATTPTTWPASNPSTTPSAGCSPARPSASATTP